MEKSWKFLFQFPFLTWENLPITDTLLLQTSLTLGKQVVYSPGIREKLFFSLYLFSLYSWKSPRC